MRRRDVLALLGGAVATWPRAARAQQGVVPVMAVLSAQTATAGMLDAIRKSLEQQGLVEGRDVRIEYRDAVDYDRLPTVAAELVAARVALIYATGSTASAVAAK